MHANVAFALTAIAASALAGPLWYDQRGETSVGSGVLFPQGASSFADAVVDFQLGGGGVTFPHTNPEAALGPPSYDGVTNCANHGDPFNDCSFVSLGAGGILTLKFETNALTGSGDSGIDLWVFEVGPAVEPTLVDISVDGSVWLNVGSTGGATSGIDIDAFGFGPDDFFQYVRLTDICSGSCTGPTAGADITAVGAISTALIEPTPDDPTPVPVPVPEPAPFVLLLAGLVGMSWLHRRRR